METYTFVGVCNFCSSPDDVKKFEFTAMSAGAEVDDEGRFKRDKIEWYSCGHVYIIQDGECAIVYSYKDKEVIYSK